MYGFRLQSDQGDLECQDGLRVLATQGPGLSCIVAPPGTGKSWFLQQLASRGDRDVVRVRLPPERAHHSALEQLAGGLAERGHDVLSTVDDPAVDWTSKVAAVGGHLDQLDPSTLIIVDDADLLLAPDADALDVGPDAGPEARSDVLRLLGQRAVQVVAGSSVRLPVDCSRWELRGTPTLTPESVHVRFDESAELWRTLLELCAHRPLTIRFACGLLNAGHPFSDVIRVVARAEDVGSPAPLVDALLCQVGANESLIRAITALSVAEQGLTASQLGEVSGSGVDAPHRLAELTLVDNVLGDRWRVHSTVRARLARQKWDAAPDATHRMVGEWEEAEYDAARPSEAGLRARGFAQRDYIHAGWLEGAQRLSGGFPGGLIELGRRYGRAAVSALDDGRDALARAHFGCAIDAYNAALALGPARPYPLHYRGWNRHLLVRAGGERAPVDEVLSDLESAARLAPGHPWYQRRLAVFLSRQGRADDATAVVDRAATSVSADQVSRAVVAPVLASLRKQNHIGAALRLAERYAGSATWETFDFDWEYALVLRRAGRRRAASRYFSGRLATLEEPPDEKYARDLVERTKALVQWLEEEGLTVEARRWSGERVFEAPASSVRTVLPVQVSPTTERGHWALYLNGELVRCDVDSGRLVRNIPATERHRYLALFHPASVGSDG